MIEEHFMSLVTVICNNKKVTKSSKHILLVNLVASHVSDINLAIQFFVDIWQRFFVFGRIWDFANLQWVFMTLW